MHTHLHTRTKKTSHIITIIEALNEQAKMKFKNEILFQSQILFKDM